MTGRLRVGVPGLGRRWERYRPALTGPESPVEVRAVCDPSARRADRVARQLRCEAGDGVEDLLDRPDVDALLLLDLGWHGLWPLERACRAGKPVFCGAPLTCDDAGVDGLRHQLRERSHPTMTALAATVSPAAARLRVLLDRHLGPARVVCCTGRVGRAATGEQLLASGALLPALHLCRDLFGAAPETVYAAAPEGSGLANLTLGFPGGRAARVSLTAGGGAGWRVEVTAEKGTAEVVLPRRLRWHDAAGEHALRLPPYRWPLEQLRRFADAVRAGKAPRPSFEDACRALAWLRAARTSHAEGRPVRPEGS